MLAFGGLLPVAVLASLQSPYGGWLHAVWLGGVNRFYTTFGAIAFVFLWRAVLLWILKGWIASVSLDLARSISAWWIERLGRAGAWACLAHGTLPHVILKCRRGRGSGRPGSAARVARTLGRAGFAGRPAAGRGPHAPEITGAAIMVELPGLSRDSRPRSFQPPAITLPGLSRDSRLRPFRPPAITLPGLSRDSRLRPFRPPAITLPGLSRDSRLRPFRPPAITLYGTGWVPGTAESGAATLSSGLRSAAKPSRHSTPAATSISAAATR